MIHGIDASYTYMDQLMEWVNEDFPGMVTVPLDAFTNYNR